MEIPIFTTQLEKAREAVDLANLRAAYAEITAEYLTSGGDTTPTAKTVVVTQKKDNWQSNADVDSTTIATNVTVTAKTSGNYTVSINSTTGEVTVS